MSKWSPGKREADVLEADVKKAVKECIAAVYPDAWYYMPVQTAYGKHGIPDFICCVPVTITTSMVGCRIGVFAGVETKRPGVVPTPRQAACHTRIRAAGGHMVVMDSMDRITISAAIGLKCL